MTKSDKNVLVHPHTNMKHQLIFLISFAIFVIAYALPFDFGETALENDLSNDAILIVIGDGGDGDDDDYFGNPGQSCKKGCGSVGGDAESLEDDPQGIDVHPMVPSEIERTDESFS